MKLPNRTGARPILLSEADVRLRTAATDALISAGFPVIELVRTDEALSLLEARRNVCGLISGLNSQGCFDGLELAHFVSNRWPTVWIVVTSGWAQCHLNLPPPARWIPSPYDVSHLIRVVGQEVETDN